MTQDSYEKIEQDIRKFYVDDGSLVLKTWADRLAALRASAQKGEPVAFGFPNSMPHGKGNSLMMVRLDIPSDDQYPHLRIPLYPHPAPAASGGTPDIKTLVDRFLGWKLPKDFAPDAGILFKPATMPSTPQTYEGYWPVGTNLLTADQARQMFEYVLAAAPASADQQGTTIKVGDLLIIRTPAMKLWLRRPEGEGMEVNESIFVRYLERYYAENF